MKFLVTADWHLTNSNPKYKLNSQGVSDLLTAQTEFGRWLANLLATDEYDGMLFLGDITDKETLDPITLAHYNAVVGEFQMAEKFKIWLEGNHCIEDTKSQYTVLSATQKIAGDAHTHFVTQAQSVDYNGQVIFHCVPYLGDYKEIEEYIEDLNASLDKSLTNVLLFHFPTTNALLDNGLVSKGGVNLSQEITSNFDLCLGGDFHTPQQLINSNNAFYVGAPFSLKFGEEDAHRGVVVLEIKEDGAWEMERIDNPFAIPVLTLTPAQAMKLSKKDKERSVVRLSQAPTTEERVVLEELRDSFYRLNIPGAKHQNKSTSTNESAERLMEAVSKRDDVSLIRDYMAQGEYNEDKINAVTGIFAATCSKD